MTCGRADALGMRPRSTESTSWVVALRNWLKTEFYELAALAEGRQRVVETDFTPLQAMNDLLEPGQGDFERRRRGLRKRFSIVPARVGSGHVDPLMI